MAAPPAAPRLARRAESVAGDMLPTGVVGLGPRPGGARQPGAPPASSSGAAGMQKRSTSSVADAAVEVSAAQSRGAAAPLAAAPCTSNQPSVIAGSGRRRTLGLRRRMVAAACPGAGRGLRTAPNMQSLAGLASAIFATMLSGGRRRMTLMRTTELSASSSRRSMPRRGGRCGAGCSVRKPTCSWRRRPRSGQEAWPGRRPGPSATDGRWWLRQPSAAETAGRLLA